MKLYVKAFSSYRSDEEDIDVKKELKSRYKLDTRRQDTFIHLAILGAQRLREQSEIQEENELFLTSGIGNVDVIQRTNMAVVENKEFIKPFDFINMLGNTTSYYVANSLGVKGKNIFDISDNFTVINTLILIYASLMHSKNEALFGSVDLASEPQEVLKRVLGVDESLELLSSVNYQKLSIDATDALAELEFDTAYYTKEEIVAQIAAAADLQVYTSMRCSELEGERDEKFFETDASYAINRAIKEQRSTLYIDSFNGKYKTLKVSIMR